MKYNVICPGGDGKKPNAACLGRYWDKNGDKKGNIDIKRCDPCEEPKRKKKEELGRAALYNKMRGT